MPSSWVSLAVFFSVLSVACGDEPLRPEPQPFTLDRDDVWSGTSVTLTSPGFSPADPHAVLLDDDTVAFTRLNDSTLVVALLDRPGIRSLRVVSPFVDSAGVTVRLNGFAESYEGPLFGGRAVAGTNPHELFGYGPAALRRWNVVTGETWDYPDSMHAVSCTRGVGAGLAAGELVLLRACGTGRWLHWRMEPSPALLDTTPWTANLDRFVDLLGPDRYASPTAHLFLVASCDFTPCQQQWTRGGGGFEVVRSPLGQYAALLAHVVSDSGAPLVSVDGPVVDYVPPYQSALGAAFTASGDTLFLAGQDHPSTFANAARLVAVRAADRLRVAAESLSYSPCAVGLDPARPWVYVAGVYRDSALAYWSVLGVYDRQTLAPIARLRVAGGVIYSASNNCRIIANPGAREVYVLDLDWGSFVPTARPSIARFDTPP